jgi:hypothetical protein
MSGNDEADKNANSGIFAKPQKSSKIDLNQATAGR